MPSSTARAMARSWSAAAPLVIKPPTAPAPYPSVETFSPVFPSVRISILRVLHADLVRLVVDHDVVVVVSHDGFGAERRLHALFPVRCIPGTRRGFGLPQIDPAAARLAVQVVFAHE